MKKLRCNARKRRVYAPQLWPNISNVILGSSITRYHVCHLTKGHKKDHMCGVCNITWGRLTVLSPDPQHRQLA